MNFKIPPIDGIEEKARAFNERMDAAIREAAAADSAKSLEAQNLSKIQGELSAKLPALETAALLSDDAAALLNASKGRVEAVTRRLEDLRNESRKSVMMEGAGEIMGQVFRHYFDHLPTALHSYLKAVEPFDPTRSAMIQVSTATRTLGLVRDKWMYATQPATKGNRAMFNNIVRRAIEGQACLLADCTSAESQTDPEPEHATK